MRRSFFPTKGEYRSASEFWIYGSGFIVVLDVVDFLISGKAVLPSCRVGALCSVIFVFFCAGDGSQFSVVWL